MVKLDRLSKRFGRLQAVDEVSLEVRRGEVLGFLGPNGAGKSTTMRMLTGFVAPTSGTASVMGFDVVGQSIKARHAIGYMPEGAPAYGDMTVESFLRFIADLRGIGAGERGERIAKAAERTGLDGVMHRPIEPLSKGYKRRVGLAQAILHDPPVLVLDEPTDGLDPNQKHEVRRLIETMAPDKAIIVSTHILEEVDAVCTRAVIIAEGRVIADETPEALKRRSRYHRAVQLSLAPGQRQGLEACLAGIEGIEAIEEVGTANGALHLRVVPKPGIEIAARVSDGIREAGIDVEELSIEQGRLDDVFRQLTAKPQHARS